MGEDVHRNTGFDELVGVVALVCAQRDLDLGGLFCPALGLPTAMARAVAPSLLAALRVATGNYTMGLSVLFALTVLAVVAFWFAQRRSLA